MAKASWGNKLLAESENYQVVEGNIYFPPESVKKQYLTPGDRQYTCPWKGKSAYCNIEVGGEVKENAAWAYPDPKPAAHNIKQHVAFDTNMGIEVTA